MNSIADKIASRAASAPKSAAKQLRKIMQGVVLVDYWRITPSPENDTLYRPISQDDPAIVALSGTIRVDGLLEPLVLSLDGYILSGHRRYAACRLAGMTQIPCRYENVSRADEPDRFLLLLRRYNQQRVKALDEQLREAVIDADPEECRAELIDYRRDKAKLGHASVLMGEVKSRCEISCAKDDMVRCIQQILDERYQYWPLSDRQIHYALLNDPPLKHSRKPDSRYRNDRKSYNSLTELLTRMRLVGLIPLEAIGDETRPFDYWDVHREIGSFITKEVDGFLKGYYRDLMVSQPNHVEIVVEKNTIVGIVKPLAMEFCIPMTSGRGYCSLPPRAAMAQRFRQSGKENLVLLLVSDFDPDGEAISESFARSMRDDFNIDAIHPVKVALTYDQVQQYELPPNMEAKVTSSRTKGFVSKYGKNVWELEALPPETLQEVVRTAIVDVIDLKLYKREQQAEASDAVQLKAIRVAVGDYMQGLKLKGGEE